MAANKNNGSVLELVKLIENATDRDVATIEERINILKSEIAKYTEPKLAEIRALTTMMKVLYTRLHPIEQKPKNSKGKKPAPMRDRIYDLIAKEGPMTTQSIAGRLSLGSKVGYVVNAVRDCNWFVMHNGEVRIATIK